MTTPTYQHDGTTIEFNANNGTFYATVDGNHMTAPSLAALKKKISASRAIVFKPFEVIDFNHAVSNVVRVVKFGKCLEGLNRGGFAFTVATLRGYERQRQAVAPNTPENKAAIDEYIKAETEAVAVRKELDAKIKALHSKIEFITGADYAQANTITK